jgi:flagellar biosynthesis/type III secretory pathway M-ring protein FliF/YscJ
VTAGGSTATELIQNDDASGLAVWMIGVIAAALAIVLIVAIVIAVLLIRARRARARKSAEDDKTMVSARDSIGDVGLYGVIPRAAPGNERYGSWLDDTWDSSKPVENSNYEVSDVHQWQN